MTHDNTAVWPDRRIAPHCSACQEPASHELLRPDGSSFAPRVFDCGRNLTDYPHPVRRLAAEAESERAWAWGR